MKVLMLTGGILGFAIGFLSSWMQESSWPTCLWHACVAAYLAGLILRWWGGVWRKGLLDALAERQSLAAAKHAPLPLPKGGKA